MKSIPFRQRLAVCSWSLQPTSPQNLIDQLLEIGLNRVQIALDPLRTHPETWGVLPELCRRHKIQLVSGMLTTVGEDYTTMESIRLTGGIVPDSTWEENWENIQTAAGLAHELKLPLVTFHAGFLPHEETDPEFEKLLHRVRLVADVFASKDIHLAFETGQETAEALKRFLIRVGRASVGVNFDPANMILYDRGNPLHALQVLGPWLKQCHIKDAIKTRQPGTWGEEVPVGTGQVDWPGFFQKLKEQHFAGDLAIEREAGTQRVEDIRTARKVVEGLPETA